MPVSGIHASGLSVAQRAEEASKARIEKHGEGAMKGVTAGDLRMADLAHKMQDPANSPLRNASYESGLKTLEAGMDKNGEVGLMAKMKSTAFANPIWAAGIGAAAVGLAGYELGGGSGSSSPYGRGY